MKHRLGLALAASALSGFVALSYELLWVRAYHLANRAQASSFPLLLGAYLLGLALGSALTGEYTRRRPSGGSPSDLAWIAGAFGLAAATGFAALPLFAAYAGVTQPGDRWPLLGLASTALGAVFPVTAHFAVPAEAVGRRLAQLYLANIAGSAVGSLATGFWLLDRLTTPQLATALSLLCALASLAFLVAAGTRRAAPYLVVAAVSAAVLALHHRAYQRYHERLIFGPREVAPFTRIIENHNGVIAVEPSGVVWGSGTYDGAFNVDPRNPINAIERAYAVAGFHPAPRRVLMIGLATGSWAQAVATLPGVERFTVVEINPGYLELLDHPQVKGLLSNPRVELVIDDGRRYLARHPEARYDAIVANTMVHWIGSSTHVLSAEYVGLIRRALAPGGIYLFNATSSLRAARTALDAFTDAAGFHTAVVTSDAPLHFDLQRYREALLAARDPEGKPFLDASTPEGAEALRRLLGQARVQARESLVRQTAAARPITDDNMGHEWDSL